jgi:flavin reductase (DIM6/NTAB) family NADH-FMN oxidoreductase RutF
LDAQLNNYRYAWPFGEAGTGPKWSPLPEGGPGFVRHLAETPEELAADSRWPGFFPSPICLVTTSDGTTSALEKVVGASIVNRFPYVLALSFCTRELSGRHHVRRTFADILERGGTASAQFLVPGAALDRAMGAVASVPESRSTERIDYTGLPTRPSLTGPAPVFDDAYLVYETRLVRPSTDFGGRRVYDTPWADVGSHRVYFLEITAIQLREDVARGETQIHWRSLPAWAPGDCGYGFVEAGDRVGSNGRYQKGYTPRYAFPSAGTVGFEADAYRDGMAVKYLPPLPRDQVEVDNDRARWPCFFPSSVGMITTAAPGGGVNLMPCGSTTIVSRHPLVVAPCVSYSAINERYAPRASLGMIRRAGRFACGVPYIDDRVLAAIRYAGNTSYAHDPDKVRRSGLAVSTEGGVPWLPALPITYDCEVVGEVPLGTHIMFLGEVRRIIRRADLTARNPLEWCPWSAVGRALPSPVAA